MNKCTVYKKKRDFHIVDAATGNKHKLTVRFDMSESLVVSTWGPNKTPTSFSDIFVSSEDIPMIFTLMQNTKTVKVHGTIFLFLNCTKVIVIRH